MDADAKRRASFAVADRRRKEAAMTDGQKAERQKAADAKKVEQQRRADAKKDTDRKAEQKREADRKIEERKTAAKQDLQRRADERRAAAYVAERQKAQAAAYVAERQKAQAADAIAEQRRQTSRIRNHHREETRSLHSNESTALNRHYHAIKRIDGAEQRALHEFDVRRGSLMGRAAELLKGGRHFDREREDIIKRHESDRLKQHRDLEALKERQFTIAQQTRLRQAHERKAIYDRHLDERRDLGKTQESSRPRQIEDRKQAFAKAAEIAQAHKHERAQERGQGRPLSP